MSHQVRVSKSPKDRVVGPPSKWPFYGLEMGAITNSYTNWDDPPSRVFVFPFFFGQGWCLGGWVGMGFCGEKPTS